VDEEYSTVLDEVTLKTTVLIYEPTDERYESKLLGLSVLDRLEKSLLRDGAGAVRAIDEIASVTGPVLIVPSTLVGIKSALKVLLAAATPAHRVEIDGAPIARINRAADVPRGVDIEAWIHDADLDSKPEDGIISRTINRPMSLFTTRILANTPVTPNQWTVFTAILGIFGCVVMTQGGYWALTIGALLIHLSSVFDGCDGELARLRFQYSKLGEWLDTICDDLVNSCLMLGLGLGIAATTGQSLYATLGVAAVILNLCCAAVIYHHLYTCTGTGYGLDFKWWFEANNENDNCIQEKMSFLSMFKFLIRRDFYVFFFFLLAAVGVPQIAAWLAFLGPLFTFVLAFMQSIVVPARRRAARQGRATLLNDAE
jgi:phosphatidylglycerophosphate synthase